MKNEPGMAYNTKTLNKVFAFLSILFLITTIWVVLDDYIRPWKKVQRDAMDIRVEVLSNKVKEFDESLDKATHQELIEMHRRSEELIKSREAEISTVEKELSSLKGKVYAEKMVNGTLNAQYSETVFKWEMALAKNKKNEPKLRKKLDDLKAKFALSKDKVKEFESKIKEVKLKIENLVAEKTEAEKKISDLVGARERLMAIIDKNKFDFINNPERAFTNIIRNAPFVDFLDPSIKIQQLVLTNYNDDRFFRETPKVDRCTTCHVFIDQPGYETQNNPFKTHPELDLMVSENSPHPKKEVGCTNCHGGEGHRVNDFSSAAHIPQDEKQKQLWVDKYHWHAPHKVPREMYRLQYTESQCLKCHEGVNKVPVLKEIGNKINEGKELVQTYGCYACHKVDGFENAPKPGPSLEKVAGKLSKDWIKNWIWNPFNFNEHSRMPSYFNQVNNQKPEFLKKSIAEVNAMADYIWKNSESYTAQWSYTGGSAEKGKELISKVGCLGCHQVEGLDDQLMKAANRRGPYLKGLGSKLDPDWLVTWLIKPSHYQSDTIMPSFRLTAAEANNIAAFLLASKNKKFESLKLAEIDKESRDEILVTYFSTFETLEVAKNKLESLNDDERTYELGKRSISKYGCYSCHAMEGFDDLTPIGPELNGFGDKPTTQLGFGHVKMEHRLDTWTLNHLQNPRQWDVGVERKYGDLLKMPNFYMKKEHAEKITTFLLGQVNEKIPPAGLRNLSYHEGVAAKGAVVIAKYNCMGCHKIDGLGGEILKAYEDTSIGPPWLVKHGERVHADWLNNFFKNVHPIRSYLEVRMPSFNFSEDERNALVNYFQSLAMKDTFVEIPDTVEWEPGEKAAAEKLWTALACTSCHGEGFTREAPQAPNLRLAKRKLRSEWIDKWLLNPQSILPETVMPNFWEGGVATEPGILGGDPKKQVQALRKYIQEQGSRNLPEGQNYLR
jgi:mono/diheme cytochrome c family protein